MPGFVATMVSQVMCSHGGQAKPVPMPARVLVMGMPVVTLSHVYAIAGCALSASGTPPCVTGFFPTGAMRVMASIGAGLSPLVVIPGMGTCQPTAQPLIPVPAGQQRVIAS
ncbi:MAG TPA: hypothetical protein VGO76_16835 [Luteibacter sp.]|nr:hypothetical protein [Luteibacter sp.]